MVQEIGIVADPLDDTSEQRKILVFGLNVCPVVGVARSVETDEPEATSIFNSPVSKLKER